MTKPLPKPLPGQPIRSGASGKEVLALDIFLFVVMPLFAIGAMLFALWYKG